MKYKSKEDMVESLINQYTEYLEEKTDKEIELIYNGDKFTLDTSIMQCEDCENYFNKEDITRYKYESEIQLCQDCCDQRMEEE